MANRSLDELRAAGLLDDDAEGNFLLGQITEAEMRAIRAAQGAEASAKSAQAQQAAMAAQMSRIDAELLAAQEAVRNAKRMAGSGPAPSAKLVPSAMVTPPPAGPVTPSAAPPTPPPDPSAPPTAPKPPRPSAAPPDAEQAAWRDEQLRREQEAGFAAAARDTGAPPSAAAAGGGGGGRNKPPASWTKASQTGKPGDQYTDEDGNEQTYDGKRYGSLGANTWKPHSRVERIGQSVAQGAGELGGMVKGLPSAAMGALGAAGPWGAAAATGLELAGKAATGTFLAFSDALGNASTQVRQTFSNDGLGLMQSGLDSASKALSHFPIAGEAASGALKALIAPIGVFKAALEAGTGRGRELAPLSGEISVALAMADMKQTFADMKEAQEQGTRYARLLIREQEMNQSFQEALAPLRAIFLDTAADIAELVKLIAEGLNVGLNISDNASLLKSLPFIGDKLDAIVQGNRAIRDALKKDDDKDLGVGDLRRMIDSLRIPGGRPAAVPPPDALGVRRGMGAKGDQELPFAMK